MRYAVSIILLFISLVTFGQLDQFRMVGSGSWSVVDDSTYSATVTFASDLTANSFLPTGVVDSMRVFTQRGQLYTIDSVGAKTFSTAVIYAVEYGGDWGSPSGQVLVYETRGRETVPAIPFATNGATSKLQEAVVTHNAAINNGVSTTQLADSTTAAKNYTNNKIASVAPVKDTIVQASHGFSVGDPIWYSGDYLLSLDTGLTVRVDGVVSEVPDINTFVLQRTGRFTLTSHGFTVGVQLYVQPDGSYSATDTSNTLVYGYALDANTIEIGVKPDYVRSLARPDSSVFSTRSYVNNNIEKKYTSYNLDTTITSSQLSGQEFTLNVSYTAPLLDRINIGDGYAYSLRKLSSDYNGPIITVVENDGDTLNVYTINSELDTASMKAFSADSLYVKRWYDQSGKAAHLSNADTINWPIVMAGGNLIRQNGKLAIYVEDADNEYLYNQTVTTTANALTYSLVYTRGLNGNSIPFGSTSLSSASGWGILTNASGNHISASNSYSVLAGREPIVRTPTSSHPSSSTPYLYFSVLSVDTAAAWVNGSYLTPNYSATGAVGTLQDGISIGNRGSGGALGWNGYIQELIVITSDQTTNKSLIYNDANGYYDFGGGDTETADLAGAVVTLPFPDASILNKEFTLNHTNSSGLYTTVKTDSSSTFDIGGTIRDSILINSANNTSVTLRVNKVGDSYAWKVVESTDTDFIPQLDTLGVKYVERIEDVVNINFEIGKKILTKSGAFYSVESDYNTNIPLDTLFQFQLDNGRYANIELVNGWLDIDKIETPSYLTETQKLARAITYMYYTKECNAVYIGSDKTYTDTHYLPENCSIVSNFSGKASGSQTSINLNGATISYDLNDSTKFAIEFVNNDNVSTYRTGSNISNIRIKTISPAKGVIDLGGGFENHIEKVNITPDSCLYGIAHISDAAGGGLYINLNDVSITSSECEYGIYLNGVSLISLKNVSVLQTGVGMYTDKGSFLDCYRCWFEDIDSSAVISSINNQVYDRLYTENIGTNGSSGFSFVFPYASSVSISNSRLNNGSNYAHFRIDTVFNTIIKGNYIGGVAANSPKVIQIDTSLHYTTTFTDNTALNNTPWREFYTNNVVDSLYLTFAKNVPAPSTNSNLNRYYKNQYPNSELKNALLNDPVLINSDIQGKPVIKSDTVLLRGAQNLIFNSEQLGSASPTNISVTQNAVSSIPDADSIVVNSAVNAYLSFTNTDGTYIKPNTVYTMSAWVSTIGGSTSGNIKFNIARTGNPDSEGDTIAVNSTMTRYSETFVSPSEQILYPQLYFIGTDTFAVYKVQITEGYYAGEYIQTTGSPILSKKVVADGDLEITGTLTAEKYRTFTPITYDNVDTLLVDRLELGFESLKITDELDGLEVKQVTYTTDRNVTADTQVRLEYFDISASSYTSFGAGTIANGTNQITVTGLTKVVEATDIIYLEVVTTGGEANGISATVKFK